jgi:hypothetical protein
MSGEKQTVYCLLSERNGDMQLLGNAFAVSPTLAVTANHNLNEVVGNILVANEFTPQLEFFVPSVREVTKSHYDVSEDWAILKIQTGNEFPLYASIASEMDLPSVGDKIFIKDYPIDLAAVNDIKLALHSIHSKVMQYSRRPADDGVSNPTQKKPRLISVAEFLERPKLGEDEVMVETGRVGGSCGAPYFNERGQAFAFHVNSSDDSPVEDEQSLSASHRSHVSYSVGRVLCRLPMFVSSWRDAAGMNLGSM